MKIAFAFFTRLPNATMLFMMMRSAQGKTVMISITAVARIRKHYIFIRIVANPISTALRLY
jgi:hypothetical protein